jgi:aminoglycoside 6'-N-acetyltransferase I
MDVRTILSTQDDAYIVKNLYPLYLHDLSEFSGEWANEHGVLEPTSVATLSEQGEVQKTWWKKPDVLYPFIIKADGRIAGFAFVARAPHVPEATDQVIHEFFVLHAFRGKGIGDRAASELFDRFPGQWQVFSMERNLRAQAFWRRVLREYTGDRFEERSGQPEDRPGKIYRFESARIRGRESLT